MEQNETGRPPITYGTPQVMERIRQVISDTTLPTWMAAVPKNYGDAAAGSLKADEWRSFATIFLPLALIKEWGEKERDIEAGEAIDDWTSSRLSRALDHTMLLVSAITLACYRVTSAERIEAYTTYMSKYLEDLKKVFYDQDSAYFVPNHHAAMHIPNFLRLFGPVHSWWTFSFERLVGVLQRMPSNSHFGASSAIMAIHLLTQSRST